MTSDRVHPGPRSAPIDVAMVQALIDQAVTVGADAIVVHHGLVWGGGIRRLTGWLGRRVRSLVAAEISLFAYHLPLDAHPTLGNNAGLAEALGVALEPVPFGAYRGQTIGLRGRLAGKTFGDVVAAVRAARAVIFKVRGRASFRAGDAAVPVLVKSFQAHGQRIQDVFLHTKARL